MLYLNRELVSPCANTDFRRAVLCGGRPSPLWMHLDGGIVKSYAHFMENIVPFPSPLGRLARRMGMTEDHLAGMADGLNRWSEGRDDRVRALMAFDTNTLRAMWDNAGENSFCGDADCADIHAALCLKGDGAYCAV